MRRLLGWLFVLATLLLVCWAAMRVMTGPGAPRDVVVVIEPGSSIAAAARTLEKSGAIVRDKYFINYARLLGSGKPIKPGEYQIKAGMDSGDILSLLQSGKTLQRFVAVYEGMPSILVYERLMATSLLVGDIAVPPEGSVLPDSYSYVRGERRQAVVDRMQKAMQTAIANAWKARKPTVAVKTPEAAIVLASIIEKETARASERRMVAAVYTNRLKRGMPLQADPTFLYPITKGKPLGRRATNTDKNIDSPYNTYRYNGLPPGPIANPGKASIEAALDPARSNAIFFVAQPDGSSAFADTLDQHNANVIRWRNWRSATGN